MIFIYTNHYLFLTVMWPCRTSSGKVYRQYSAHCIVIVYSYDIVCECTMYSTITLSKHNGFHTCTCTTYPMCTHLKVTYMYAMGASTGLHVSYGCQHWLTRIVRCWLTRITHLESHVGANEDVDEHHETEHAQSWHQKTWINMREMVH